MKNLIGPNIGLHFRRHNSVVVDTTHDLIHFPHLTMQVKNAAIETSAKPQSVLIQDNTIVPTTTTKTITGFVDHPSEWHTTSTVTPMGKFTEAASLLISHSVSTTIDKNTAVRVINVTELPFLINSNVPRSQEVYKTEVSEEIEGRVTIKLSQEFSRTENHKLGALARLDDLLKNPLV